ncbi:MAG: glycoside hydrolase family 88 protein [Promicromonosporaceae bacterium]|nr:glycoside hydrolase family 88 protein [Promicromonosporaceae bacterium]
MSSIHDKLLGVLPGAVANARVQTRANALTWASVFPEHNTTNGFWTVRAPDRGMTIPGTNQGWTTGFWTGMMWLASEYEPDPVLEATAAAQSLDFTRKVTAGQNVETHDLGFMHSLSNVADFKLHGTEKAREGALLAADYLMRRFVEPAGIIQAWGTIGDGGPESSRTIVDSLMNLPLLFWASEQTGDPKYAAAAHRHATRLAENIIRPDGSMFHTFYWDPKTGAPLRGDTHQGYADDSTWARGQTWGIYGFTMAYQATGDIELLKAAIRVSDYYLDHLPPGLVPYWDLVFDDDSGEERDTSAAAIAYDGLVELATTLEELTEPEAAQFPDRAERALRYREAADEMLYALITKYTPEALNRSSDALLLESVYNKPKGFGVNEATLFGDYFYAEALMRASNPTWQRYW